MATKTNENEDPIQEQVNTPMKDNVKTPRRNNNNRA